MGRCVSAATLSRWLAIALAVLLSPAGALAQRGVGEIHLLVVDESGAPVAADGLVTGAATQVRRRFTTGQNGRIVLAALPFGAYEIGISRSGFTPLTETLLVESVLPLERIVRLRVAGVQAVVSVIGEPDLTLLNPTRTGSVRYVGADSLSVLSSAAPGRSLIDLVNTQPGWLLEANGILHARGSEYQVQYVIDGIPLRDNRSPAFAQSLGVGEFDSMAIRTGGYPAEFGGKLGGVIELNTARDTREGWHGSVDVQFGSFSTASGHAALQYGSRGVQAGLSAEGMTTDRYLDPPTEDNFTNEGRAHGAAGRFERAWTDGTRTRGYAYGHRTRFQVPNELLQQAAGQRQDRSSVERLGQAAHQHVLAPSVLLNLGIMVRRTEAALRSNPFSVPIRAFQDRAVTEGYVNSSVTAHRGSHEWRAGGEAVFGVVREEFDSTITAREFGGREVFDADVPAGFSFAADQAIQDQAFFVQDVMRVGRATVSAGLRYDRHRLIRDEHAWSPRLSASLQLGPFLVLHGAYDRTFETQPIENILLASADVTEELGGEAVFKPLRSSRGHLVEAGAAITAGGARLEATWFRRAATHVTDDELLLNTAVSFPIAFASAKVRGLEIAVDAPRWGAVSASASYSLSRGIGRLPLTGGLFLDAQEDDLVEDEEFELSQDQRHTLRTRVRAGLGRTWVAGVFRFDSGLPVEIEEDGELDPDALIDQFGPDIVAQVDFERGRVRYGAAIDVSAGVRVLGRDSRTLSLQVDLFNAFDRLNVINFAGLLSGTAVAPQRSFAARLRLEF